MVNPIVVSGSDASYFIREGYVLMHLVALYLIVLVVYGSDPLDWDLHLLAVTMCVAIHVHRLRRGLCASCRLLIKSISASSSLQCRVWILPNAFLACAVKKPVCNRRSNPRNGL